MKSVHHLREITSLIQQRLKLLNRLLLRQLQQKLLLYLLMHVPVLDIRNIRVNHEGDEVEYQVGRLAQDGEAGEAEVLEAGVVHGLSAAHGIDHFFANFDGRRKGLWVAAEDISEVDVEEMTCIQRANVS